MLARPRFTPLHWLIRVWRVHASVPLHASTLASTVPGKKTSGRSCMRTHPCQSSYNSGLGVGKQNAQTIGLPRFATPAERRLAEPWSLAPRSVAVVHSKTWEQRQRRAASSRHRAQPMCAAARTSARCAQWLARAPPSLLNLSAPTQNEVLQKFSA